MTQSIVHVREIMKPLILSNTDTFFIGHHHPSGYLEASDNDILFTKRLKEAGELIGIKLGDHLIVNDQEYYSLKEFGLC
ncbi:JAB domain-containing protein [uncultured Vagococcus sp.]|uniref:JAB domain-containing protein n=1 Tax=uncultured Vagococcus sp. TaxID=189676 RepID=UPI0028D7CD8E|nr:JAB domain-containing protein [uncultured Vagococcus sp.]